SPSGLGAIRSSLEKSANAGSTNPKPPVRTLSTAPASARAVPAHNLRRVTRTGISSGVVIARRRVAPTKQSRAARLAPGLLRRFAPRNDVLARVASVAAAETSSLY